MKLIYHCSDSDYGNVAELTKWHLQRGWRTIGYHYVILNGQLTKQLYNMHFDGWLETGRALDADDIIDEWEKGAHAKGWNENSIGVCLIGKSGKFTKRQINTAIFLRNLLSEQFFELETYTHSDFDPKKWYCPGFTEEQKVLLGL